MHYPRPLLVVFSVSAVTAVTGMLALPLVAVLARGSAIPSVACASLVALGFLATAETLREAERRRERDAAGLPGYGPWDADDRWAALVGASLLATAACIGTMVASRSPGGTAATALCVALSVLGVGLIRFQAREFDVGGKLARLVSRLRTGRGPTAG